MSETIRFPRAMGNEDALMWHLEEDPGLRSTTAAVTILEKSPPREALIAKLRRASAEIPRLRQRVTSLPRTISTPIWRSDPHFDLDYHLRWMRAPRDASLRSVLHLAASLAMQGFDRARPLWEFVVVDDLDDGRAAIIQKLHHSVIDGIGGLMLMGHVYDGELDSPPTEQTVRPAAEAFLRGLARRSRAVHRNAARLVEAATHPLHTARRTASELASVAHVLAPALGPMSPIMRERSTRYRFEAWTVSLPEIKAAAHAADCKLNDAFLAALAAGWRLYHERHGVEVDQLRISLPINLRANGPRLVAGNRLMLARFPVPIGERDPSRRMRTIRQLVARERAEPALAHAEALAGLLNLMPPSLLAKLAGSVARNVDFIASCVPGPTVPLYIAGARVDSLFAFGPPAGAAANITLLSYRDQAQVTINADPASIPDHDLLRECMRQGFAETLRVRS